MIAVAKDDVLRGLKKFKRLAKQDILASPRTSEPEFWREQAEARREMYTKLMSWVEYEGVDAACRMALDELAALPLLHSSRIDPARSGKEQALGLFLQLVGVDRRASQGAGARNVGGPAATGSLAVIN